MKSFFDDVVFINLIIHFTAIKMDTNRNTPAIPAANLKLKFRYLVLGHCKYVTFSPYLYVEVLLIPSTGLLIVVDAVVLLVEVHIVAASQA